MNLSARFETIPLTNCYRWRMKSQSQLSQRSRLVGAVNRVLPAIWKTPVMDAPELDAENLCEQVQRETGLADFGNNWFRKPLDILVRALEEEASLNQLGRFGAAGQLKKVLKDRLFTQHLLDEHPEIRERTMHPPVIVVGPMRSGTTRLHRLLAADDRFSHMRFFETICPVPRPGFRKGRPDRRWLPATLLLGAVHRLNPNTAVIHPTGPHEPEEELGLLVASMWGMKHEAQWHIPSYGRWSEAQDPTPAYEHMAQLLRIVGWARGDDDSRPWVLKTPQHMLDLPALLRVFPGARIIFTHREPQAVVGSSCSLVWNQMIIHSDRVDAATIGREWLRKTELQIERMRLAREQIPESHRIDVRYEDMERDWPAVMRRIYRFLDLDIETALPTMSAYIDDAERERHRHPHRYSLTAFGLSSNEVRERFETYMREFSLRSPGETAHSTEEPIAFPEAAARRPVRPIGDWDQGQAAPAAAQAAAQR